MKNILNRINSIFKNINYPLAAFFLVIIIGIFTLFIKPIIGMADNGDFYRVISSNGVYELNPMIVIYIMDIFIGIMEFINTIMI